MGIIDTLGSRRRLNTALQSLLSEDELRGLTEEFRLSIPGFRIGKGPAPLLARAIAVACERDRPLRRAVESRLVQVAQRLGGGDTGLLERLAEIEGLPVGDARALLATALADARGEVAEAAVGVVDAIEAGTRRLPRGGGERVPSRPGPRESSPAEAHRPKSPPSVPLATSDRNAALTELRREATRQESVRSRLRHQLASERDAHAATRRELKALRARGHKDPALARALDEARARLRQREAEVVELRSELASARTDLALLIHAARALEAVAVERFESETRDEPVRPSRPRRSSDVPAVAKVRIPTSEMWPARFDAFLRRLADDELVDAVHVIGASAGRSSRVLADLVPGRFIAQISDGHRAAQLLVLTTADSRPTHYWLRRHLASEYFDGR